MKENTWIVNGLQASLFPNEKEKAARKGDSDGMTLRKRKNQASAAGSAGVTGDPDERPRKRTRTSKAVEKRAGETQPPASRASQRATPSIAVTSTDEPASKATKLELINVELPPVGTIEVASLPVPQSTSDTLDVPSPEPTRRSARQANKRPAATVSAVSTPMTELASLPDTLSPMSSVPAEIAQEAPRPPLTRARSSSSSSGSSTAVSDSGSGGDTAVEPDSAEADGKGKDKVTAAQGKQAEPEEKVAVRTSGRVRKPAKKIMPIRKNGHLLLVTLLLANMIVNETLPVISDPVLGGGVQSVVVSTVLIVLYVLFISQIIPSCLHHKHNTQSRPVSSFEA